ncbi:MAG: glycoside hydrolase family 2 [Candidatus Lokiarchaeota archaeon]|nr:glycoside hydrolase family 2 [Candidatus Lokiarchaeota archaeon]
MENLSKANIPRPEYPRPQFVREDNWINLNGEWDFCFDDADIGLKDRWYKGETSEHFDRKITVPFCFQSKLSGIEDKSFHEVIWYRRVFEIPKLIKNKKVLLHFGSIDYKSLIYLNGEYVGSHEGGYIGFSLDITNYLEDINTLVVRVEDPSQDLEIPRGKQFWKSELELIFYPRVSGIWQTVWLEFLSPEYYIENLKITPNIDKSEVIFEINIDGMGFSELYLFIDIIIKNKTIAQDKINLDFIGKFGREKNIKVLKEKIEIFHKDIGFYENPNRFKFKVKIPKDQLFLWDIDSPNLYDLSLKVQNEKTGEVYDEVSSYFGMRKISISDYKDKVRQILLNGKPLYQKLFLVQGYWPDTLYTPPSDDHIIKDIQFIIDFGFNGLRTHQKAFDPRFLYWCDKMGVLVWGEIGNAFRFSVKSRLRLINEFVAEIERDYNHPSIIAWVPLNEGWGVSGAERDPKRGYYTSALYFLIKSVDSTRLIIDDDGYWHTETNDICTRHHYPINGSIPETLEEELNSHKSSVPRPYLKHYEYQGEPIIYSEIGGFGYDFKQNIEKKWGYGDLMKDSEDLFENVLQLLKKFDARKEWIHGFCYTELYDQFQEINGLLTFDREPKFPPHKLKERLDIMFF